MKRIKQILIKFLSNQDIENEYSNRFVEDINVDSLDEGAFALAIQDMANVENIDDFLLTTIKKDRVRHFNSPKESQDIIKGAALRTIWLLQALRKSREKKEKVANVKYTNPKHG